MNKMRAIHPGEILREEFMDPMGLSTYALAKAVHVPPNRILAITKEQRAISADTALRLAKALNTTPEFWLNLQQTYDLKIAAAETDTSEVEVVAA